LETGEECHEIRNKSTVSGDHGFVAGTGTVVGKIKRILGMCVGRIRGPELVREVREQYLAIETVEFVPEPIYSYLENFDKV